MSAARIAKRLLGTVIGGSFGLVASSWAAIWCVRWVASLDAGWETGAEEVKRLMWIDLTMRVCLLPIGLALLTGALVGWAVVSGADAAESRS
jgi:hypothetical protein